MSKWRKRTSWWNRLRSRYRLVVMNDDTLEEETSFRLSRLNIYIWLSTLFVIVFVIVVMLVMFTPLREYILGYNEIKMRKDLIKHRLQVDSLEQELRAEQRYRQNLRNIMTGHVDTSVKQHSPERNIKDSIQLIQHRSAQDSMLRAEVEQKEQYHLSENAVERSQRKTLSEFYFFTPIKGTITNEFDPEKQHLGVDIVAPENTVIKAVMDGMVVFSDWTAKAGKVIAIQHSSNIISFYKHNSVLLKKSGTFVRSGDAIAIIGNTGELTTGPHLHFELWYKGTPLDPTEYILFN